MRLNSRLLRFLRRLTVSHFNFASLDDNLYSLISANLYFPHNTPKELRSHFGCLSVCECIGEDIRKKVTDCGSVRR